MELGYVAPEGQLVIVDTIGWRSLFSGFQLSPGAGTLRHLTRTETLTRRADVSVRVFLHRKGWSRRGEEVLRRTRAIWYRGRGLELLIGPKARSIRVPWRGELTKVRRPFFALEAPIRESLGRAVAHRGSPCLVWLDRSTIRACRLSGRTVEVFATERKEFSNFILGKLRATIEFASESDAIEFCAGVPGVESPAQLDDAVAPDITRSKRIAWTPKVLAVVVGGLAFFTFVISGTIVGALQGKLADAAQATIEIVAALSIVSWALPLLLRTRRREFLDLVDKWPRVLCQRWGSEYREQAQRASETLVEMGVRTNAEGVDLAAVDALLRSLPAETFYGTFALQIGLLGISRLLQLVGRPVEFWWEYLPDRRECAFRVEAAGLRLYPLTAVLAVWQNRDPEGLDPFIRNYARELQMRLAFATTGRALVALGMTAQEWEAFPRFSSRVEGELRGRAPDRTERIEHKAIRERVLHYGAIEIVFVEESPAEESRFVPMFAFPRATASGSVLAHADSTDSGSEYLAALRVGSEGVPVFAWVVPGTIAPTNVGDRETAISGIVQSGRLLPSGETPQSFDLAAAEAEEEEARTSLASLRARVADVKEGTNEFTGSGVWILILDFGSFRIPVVAGRDMWTKSPVPGDTFDGTAWLASRRPGPP